MQMNLKIKKQEEDDFYLQFTLHLFYEIYHILFDNAIYINSTFI